MKQLEQIVNYYLTSDTNYALMITGEWGVGKTYYFKNILKNQIKDTATFEDNSKKYKPILVSLFGLKSIEEIQTEIFLSLHPILKNKTVKLGASIGKALIKGIMHLKNLGEYYDYVTEVEVDKGDWIKLTEIVICFDDLERLSKNLNIEEFIGYVNSLVENENVKILIIANENKIKRHNYFTLKEKVVGNSIEFIPDTRKNFESLIEIKFGGFEQYKAFLNENKEMILEIYTKNSNNLRILSFALTYFNSIFSQVSCQISTYEILNAKKEEILLSLLEFSLTISIEYKEGKITFKQKTQLSEEKIDWDSFYLKNFQLGNPTEEKKEVNKTYREKFIEKYYPNKSFTFFTSIFNFITGGSILQFEELITELKKLYHIEENLIPPHYEVYNQLNTEHVFSLSNKDYKHLVRKMLRFTDIGLYDISHYLNVFHLTSRFNNPLNLNLDKLVKRIIAGMKNGKSNYKYQDSLDFYLTVDDCSEHKDRLLKIRKLVLDINNELSSGIKKIDCERLEASCYKCFRGFYEEVLKPNNQYFYEAIFKNFNANKFYQFFLKSNGNTKWLIVRFWSNRYRELPNSVLKTEVDFLEILKNKLTIKLNVLPKSGPSTFIFNEHVKILQTSIDNLNRTL